MKFLPTSGTESFIALITDIWKLSSIYIYIYIAVISSYFLYWVLYCTHHSDMDALQYVCVDVPTSNFWYWMFNCIHHSDIDALLYGYLDVPLSYVS